MTVGDTLAPDGAVQFPVDLSDLPVNFDRHNRDHVEGFVTEAHTAVTTFVEQALAEGSTVSNNVLFAKGILDELIDEEGRLIAGGANFLLGRGAVALSYNTSPDQVVTQAWFDKHSEQIIVK